MRPRPGIAALLVAGALAACVQPAPPAAVTSPPAASRPATGKGPTPPAETQLSARFIGFVGPKIQHAPPFLGVPYTNFYCLRSALDRQTGESVHQLYVADSYYGAFRGWDGARDAAGRVLPFAHISTNKFGCESSCAYAEEFAATLPEAELRSSGRDLAVTFAAHAGDAMTIELSAALIASQLAAVAGERRRLAIPTAATQR